MEKECQLCFKLFKWEKISSSAIFKGIAPIYMNNSKEESSIIARKNKRKSNPSPNYVFAMPVHVQRFCTPSVSAWPAHSSVCPAVLPCPASHAVSYVDTEWTLRLAEDACLSLSCCYNGDRMTTQWAALCANSTSAQCHFLVVSQPQKSFSKY